MTRLLMTLVNTPVPPDFYRVSKLVLMPSLWWQSFPRSQPCKPFRA
jgi:hypothetical protein